MSTKKVDLEDFSDALEDILPEDKRLAKKAIVRGLRRSLADLADLSPVDTGLYASSWDIKETEKSAILMNYAPYAGVIEYGARPFTPPIGPLLGWAKRVLKDPSQPPKYSSRVWALAKHTQKKISEHGMQPRHVLENALPKIIENIRLELKHG